MAPQQKVQPDRQLPYKIFSCSSQDDNNAAIELVNLNGKFLNTHHIDEEMANGPLENDAAANLEGWHSQRFCVYP